jgi:4-carboxymuconolactone decarboxylase
MGSQQRSTPETSLRALASGEASVLQTLTQMEVHALERSALDAETYTLIRLAALVATDAAPVSYLAHLDAGGGAGIPMEKILWTLVAITPIVGSARVLSAASRMDQVGLLTTER